MNKLYARELARGNTVVEDSAWPPKCRKLVILRRKFGKHRFPDLVYELLDDPHYWFAEYRTTDGSECLACRC